MDPNPWSSPHPTITRLNHPQTRTPKQRRKGTNTCNERSERAKWRQMKGLEKDPKPTLVFKAFFNRNVKSLGPSTRWPSWSVSWSPSCSSWNVLQVKATCMQSVHFYPLLRMADCGLTTSWVTTSWPTTFLIWTQRWNGAKILRALSWSDTHGKRRARSNLSNMETRSNLFVYSITSPLYFLNFRRVCEDTVRASWGGVFCLFLSGWNTSGIRFRW